MLLQHLKELWSDSSSQAGLRDFDYMKGVTSIAELRKRMRLTGAEVLPKKIHKCEDLLLISDRQHQGWSEQLHLGGPLRHRRRCQVRSTTTD